MALLDDKMKQRIKKAIEKRLLVEPNRYGRPLRKTLKGYWRLRVVGKIRDARERLTLGRDKGVVG